MIARRRIANTNEQIERTVGLDDFKSGRTEQRERRVAAAFELRHHGIYFTPSQVAAGQRGERGVLREGAGVRRRVRLERGHATRQPRRSDRPPDAPTGHRERLRDAIDNDKAVEVAHDREQR